MNFVGDLISEEQWMSYDYFQASYDIKCNFLNYFSVISAVSKHYKHQLAQHTLDREIELITQLTHAKKTCSFAYQLLCQNNTPVPAAKHKWESEFNCERGVINVDWSKVFSMPYKCTIQTKDHYFQFRFIHRILPTNEFLYKIGKIKNDTCSFCRKNKETMKHLMWDCHNVSNFWDNIMKWLSDMKINVQLTYFVVCLGCHKDGQSNIFINMIILFAKRYIYRCRVQELKVNFNVFKEWLFFMEKVENSIALGKNKYGVHVRKWEPLYS